MQRFAKSLFLLVLIAAVSAGVGVAHYALRGGDLSPLQDPQKVLDGAKAIVQDAAEPEPAQPPPQDSEKPGKAVQDTGDIQVYFAPCQPMNPFGIDDAFIGFIESAKRSIYGAFYELELPEAARALVAKHNAGVDVRLVSDSEYRNDEAVQACIAAGIPVVFDDREPFMHDKFCVVDGARVWTGSTNITENCMYRNDNNSLLIASPSLGEDYTREFLEMFDQHKFGKGSPRDTPFPVVNVGDTRVECYFAPEDHVQRHIEDAIDDARSSIDVMAFSFTSKDLARAMAKRLEKGVRVRALFDSRGLGSQYSQDEFLAGRGAEVHADQNPYAMHNKVILIDADVVITGSYNFTASAETKNDENILILHSPAIAHKYEDRFESLLPK